MRGRDVAERFLLALPKAYRRRLADPDGSALELMEWLAEHGLLAGRLPHRLVAEQALRLLVALTPMIVRAGRGRYRVLLRAYRDDEVHADRLAELLRLQTADDIRLAGALDQPRCEAREAADDAARDPGAADAPCFSDRPVHVGSVPGMGPAPTSGAEQRDSSRTRAASQCQDVGRPISPAGPRCRSRSSWRTEVSRGKHKHVRKLGELVLRHLPHVRGSGTPAEVVERLARREGLRLSSREKYRLARALLTLQRRGLLMYGGDTWYLPTTAPRTPATLTPPPVAPSVRPVSSTWSTISEAVEHRWGTAARFDLEARGGFIGELLDLAKQAEPHVLGAALAKALSGPAPRARVGAALAKNLRLAIAEERRTLPTQDVAAGADTPYMRALAAAMAGSAAPCRPGA